MLLDFDFHQLMRLSSIKRWGIIEMSRDQSVAEHSYNVCVISVILRNEHTNNTIRTPKIPLARMMEWAVAHDLPELVTGDLPTPFKRDVSATIDKFEKDSFPGHSTLRNKIKEEDPIVLAIVKMADMIDAIQFATKFCVDTRRDTIIAEMIRKLDGLIHSAEEEYTIGIRKPISQMIDVV